MTTPDLRDHLQYEGNVQVIRGMVKKKYFEYVCSRTVRIVVLSKKLPEGTHTTVVYHHQVGMCILTYT